MKNEFHLLKYFLINSMSNVTEPLLNKMASNAKNLDPIRRKDDY
jgi:hypothetical protein